MQERLTQARSLPNVSKPPIMLQPLSSTSRVVMIGLSSEELTELELSVLARWTIRPRLMGVPGVANVARWGQRERQLQVQVDPARLRRRGVTLHQVISSTGNAQLVSPLSFLRARRRRAAAASSTRPTSASTSVHVLPIGTPRGAPRRAVDGTDGKLRLGDVAEVVEDHQPLIGDAVVDDGPGLLLVGREVPRGEHPRGDARGRGRARGPAPGLTGLEVDTTVFRPAELHRGGARQPRDRAALGGLLLLL